MHVGPLQDIQLDSDLSWEIKTIIFVLYSFEIKESVLKNIPLLELGPLQNSQLDSGFIWEIKTKIFVLYSHEIKESGP